MDLLLARSAPDRQVSTLSLRQRSSNWDLKKAKNVGRHPKTKEESEDNDDHGSYEPFSQLIKVFEKGHLSPRFRIGFQRTIHRS
jgi:hypothetical protein